MFTPITDPANPGYMPSIVFDCPGTGADYDTLLSLVNDWCVYVHLHNDDGVERLGRVDYRPGRYGPTVTGHPGYAGGDCVVLRHVETDEVVHVVPLADVKYIQIG